MHRWGNAAIVVSLGLCLSAQAGETPRLPDLPKIKVTDFLPEVRSQVQRAYHIALQHPKDAEASGKLGMLLDLYGRPGEARVCYQRAHQLEPRSFGWAYYLGSLMAKQGKQQEAVETLRAALALRPDYLPARLKLAESLFAAGELDQSYETYTAITKQFPASAEANYGLGRISAARGNQAAAIEFFRRACELFPTYGAAHYALALADRRLGKEEEAQQQLALYARNRTIVPPVEDPLRDELRELDMAASSHLERGIQLAQVGRLEDAIAETEKAVQLDPKLVKAHINLIILYGRIGNLQKAEEHYRAAVDLNPSQFADAYYDYGVALMNAAKFDEAEQNFRKAIEINPAYAAAHNDLGYLLERQGKLSEAVIQYKMALEERPDDRQAHFNLGRILVNQQKYQRAIEQFRQTLTPVDKRTPSYLYALGAAYGRAGETQNALRYLREARAEASKRGQAELLADIQRDLRAVEAQLNSRK